MVCDGGEGDHRQGIEFFEGGKGWKWCYNICMSICSAFQVQM